MTGMIEESLPEEERITRYTGELIAYMRSQFPMRFYSGEKWWTLYTAAALLRMADMAESVLDQMPSRRDLDAAADLRALYELMVTVVWMLADPETRKPLWEGEALIQQLKLHRDLENFGEALLEADEIASAEQAQGMPSLADRAKQADEYWASRVAGLHVPGHLLSFRGLYNAIYRLGSQPTHGSIASLLPYLERESTRVVVRSPQPETRLPYALVSPLLAITLIVVASEVKWIDAEKVRALNDLATGGPASA